MSYSAKFLQAMKTTVLPNEGGYSDDEADHGGKTRYGVTIAEAQAHGYTGDMRDFPLDSAYAIYAADYWLPCFELFAQPIATKVFDCGINCGPGTSRKLLQKALNAIGCNLTVDGSIGPASVSAVLSADPDKLLNAYRAQMRQRYLDIIAADPSQAKFRTGWLRRAAQ